jgi:hypothetical protein
MQSEYKYFRKADSPRRDAWRLRKADVERTYDLVLIDIIDNGMMLTHACRKHGVNETSFTAIARAQRSLGVNIPTGRWKPLKFDPNGIYKYWVPPATCEEKQTVEYGKMMDVAIQQHIDGESLEVVSERFGFPPETFSVAIRRCRKSGSPIPHMPARGWGHKTEADPNIFEFVDGHNQVKPSVVQAWVEKRLQGYPATWIAGEYRVAPWTVSRLTKPYINP